MNQIVPKTPHRNYPEILGKKGYITKIVINDVDLAKTDQEILHHIGQEMIWKDDWNTRSLAAQMRSKIYLNPYSLVLNSQM